MVCSTGVLAKGLSGLAASGKDHIGLVPARWGSGADMWSNGVTKAEVCGGNFNELVPSDSAYMHNRSCGMSDEMGVFIRLFIGWLPEKVGTCRCVLCLLGS